MAFAKDRLFAACRPDGAVGRWKGTALAAVSLLALAACDQSEKTRKVMDQRAEEAQQSLDSTHKVNHPVLYDPLTVSTRVWSGSRAMRMQHGLPLPTRYEVPRGVTLVSADPMTLGDIANAITAQTGIPVRLIALTTGVTAKSTGATRPGPGAPIGASPVSPGGFGGPSPVAPGANRGGNAPSGGDTALSGLNRPADIDSMPVSYEGPLSGLLERVSAYFGTNWHYDGSSIAISRYETRIFTVEALPGSQQVNEGMQDDVSSSSGGGSSTGSGGSVSTTQSQNTLTQNSKFTMDFKYWDELQQVLKTIVGDQGNVVVSPSMGTVTITTTSEVMDTVSDYLNKENRRLSRQIAINVQIYSVNLGQSEDFSLAFTGFLRNLTKFSGLNYTTASAPTITNAALSAADLGSLSIAIINGPNDPMGHAGDVFNALSTIGDTTSVAQFPMTTLNNRPVSRRVGTDTAYISSVTQNTTSTTATSTILTPTTSTIHDGFSLQLTPRLLDDGRILLQYSLSLIGLDSLTTDATYGIALPVTDNRIFVQQSLLRSGSTLIIGGVDQEKLAQNEHGVGAPDNFLLGGGISSNNNHYMMFMAITPQVMDVGQEHD